MYHIIYTCLKQRVKATKKISQYSLLKRCSLIPPTQVLPESINFFPENVAVLPESSQSSEPSEPSSQDWLIGTSADPSKQSKQPESPKKQGAKT